MNKRLRGLLIVALVLALVTTVGGMEVLPNQRPDRPTDSADGGFVDRVRDATRRIVGGGRAPARPEAVGAGLALDQQAPPGQAWPAQKRVKELAGKRTANSRVYALADGRTQAEISAAPINYRDAKGSFQPIDTRVRSVKTDGYVQGNATNAFTSLFGDSSDKLVRFARDARSISLGLAGPASAAAPRVDGSTVTYPGLVDGADVVYEVTSSALKEKIVLRRAPSGPVSFTFTLDTVGLEARQREDGSIAFVRPSGGEPVFVMPAPFMYDAKDDATSPHGKVWSDKVTQKVDGSTVTITADAAWLADKARVYPVVIDPTIRIQPVPTDAKDVQIYSGDPTHAYQGDVSNWQLRVGTDASQTWRSLVQFDVSSIPQNTAIDDAQLSLYYSQTHTRWQYDVPLEARRVTTAWDEDTATWNNMNANMAAAPSANVVTRDDGDAGTSISGTWPYSTNTVLKPLAVNADYRSNSDATTGNTHTWVPTLTESGDYQVEVHYVGASDRATNAPYTVYFNGGSKQYAVNQTTPNEAGAWVTLGTHPFVAGTTGRVVLGDVSGKAVIADAVRFTKAGAVKKYAKSSVWNTFPVRNTVQDWVNGTYTNNGFMIKALDEATKDRGGPIYEASEYAYMNDRRDYNLPKLVVTWGKPGVAVNPPTTVTSTGAVLDWPAYTGPAAEIAEYQIHRSVHQQFTPSSATLIAPVSKTTLSYQDTTAVPTAADETDPMKRKFYYYMVAVKTTTGEVIAGPTQAAMLPKAGQITRIYRTGTTDTTLSATRETENVDVYDGDPYVGPGNNSTVYGDSRGLVKFPTLTGIPATARVVDAQLRMYNTYLYPGTNTADYVDVYRLTKTFDETTATWQRASAATPWTAAGGDYDTSWKAGANGFTNDPEWATWDVTSPVKGWVTTPTSNTGFLLRMRDEAASTARAMLLSSEGEEPLLRPTLEVTYLEQTAESTYYAAATPELVAPTSTYSVPVSLSNPTLADWNPTDWELSYRWKTLDGEPVEDASAQAATALPRVVAAGGTVDMTAQVKTPPPSADGNKRTDFTLNWELHNKLTGKWLSDTAPIPALPQQVAVEEPTSDQLGLEKFYSYAGKNTGSGSALMNNLYAGNTVWSYDPVNNPSRGLSTFVRLAYNSLDTSDTVAGYGWSLQATSMMRLGTPLDFHPNPNPTKVTLTDGDGTSHWFTWDSAAGEWKSPKGVNLYLERNPSAVCDNKSQDRRAWSMTRPDRTQFFYDCDGYLSVVTDNNGNEMVFTYEERKSNNKPTKFLKYLTDPSNRQTLTIDYYSKGQSTYDYVDDVTWTRKQGTSLTNPKIIDHVSQITDISGRKITFAYTDKGLLGELIDGYGSTKGAPKVFKFQYDMTQGNKNVKLVKVTDPRGNPTTLAYYSPPQDDPKFHWTTKSYSDRLGHPIQFAYTDPDGPQGNNIHTTVADAENHATAYQMDGFGRPIQTTNAKNETTKLGWDDDHNVIRLEEANGAVSTWAYDAKTGYPTEVRDAESVAQGYPGTVLTYQRQMNGYVADLASKTSPEGRKWTFGYTAEGDVASVTDPLGNTTATADEYTSTNTYDTWGQLRTATDANGNTTKYDDYHESGYPRIMTDAAEKATTYGYDVRGQVLKITDALGHDTTQGYDTFGRPLEKKVPKDAGAGIYITTPAPTYDANDNITEATAPNGAVTTAVYDASDRTTSDTTPKYPGGPERVTTYGYDKTDHLTSRVEPKGNVPGGNPDSYRTTYGYNDVYQLVSVTDADGGQISYTYDNAGNVTNLVDARKNASPDPDDNAGVFAYDRAHRRTTVTDAIGKTATREYDRDGNVVAQIDRAGQRSETVLDARGMVEEERVPRKDLGGGAIEYAITKHEYDEVGNETKVISPRGVATTDDPDDFAEVTVYDELNRVKEKLSPYDRDDARVKTPDKTVYTYDPLGRPETVSAPPSAGQSVRNDTRYTYFDNGWVRTSADPWDIVTRYDYDDLGAQTLRSVTTAGESSSARSMSWDYFPDGKLRTRTDEGVPAGRQVVLVDNSDAQNVTATGNWPTATAIDNQGYDYATHTAGTGSETFSWGLTVQKTGTYQVYVRYPAVAGAATDARYTVKHGGSSTVATVNQATRAGTWVSIGSFAFAAGNSDAVTLSDQAGGTVAADAVKLVRDNAGEVDTEAKHYDYAYDPNGNLSGITDGSSGALVDSYRIDYDVRDQPITIAESKAGVVRNTTTFTYDENGAPRTRQYDNGLDTFEYDPRGLLSKVVNATPANDPAPKVTAYTYTDLGQTLREIKPNGNTVQYAYFLDGALRQQVEKKTNGTLVGQHDYEYDLNNNRTKDASRQMNADNHAAYLDRETTYVYDPRDRVASVTKTGNAAGTETYVHDANNNVISQTVAGVTTTSTFDRNRLLKATQGGVASRYNYDPYGRLDTVTVGTTVAAQFTYDGFDRTIEQRTGAVTTRTAYDPLDRTATKTENVATAKEKTTTYAYLGLTDKVLTEQSGGDIQKAYQYAPSGELLSQEKRTSSGAMEDSFFAYNAHSDVENVTDQNGDTRSTYGYTAYGADEEEAFTGVDKPDAADPTKESYNAYRFNAMRWDSGSATYDMGFRDYDPGLNRFLTRDSYNGALADMHLGTDVWTSNRYAFAGGNPISGIEYDGHISGHDAAVVATSLEIEAWAKANGINGWVSIDYGPGGRTTNAIPEGSETGGTGYADIIFWGEDVVYIWEVKPGNPAGKAAGPPQLQRYIDKMKEHLEANGDSREVQHGPGMPRVGNVPSNQGPIDVWSGGPGMRYYGNSKQPKGKPTPPPVPVPVPAQQPQEQPAKQPSDDGWKMPDWVVPVGGAILVVAGVVAVGALVADDLTGVGVLDDFLVPGAAGLVVGGWAMLTS